MTYTHVSIPLRPQLGWYLYNDSPIFVLLISAMFACIAGCRKRKVKGPGPKERVNKDMDQIKRKMKEISAMAAFRAAQLLEIERIVL